MMRWFRFYGEVLNDPKVQCLDPELFKHWVNILCLASNNNGMLPVTLHETAYALRVTDEVCQGVLDELEKRRLLEVSGDVLMPHGWEQRQFKSDTSNERVARYRKRHGNVTVTPPDTDTEQIQNIGEVSPITPLTRKNVKQETNRGTRFEKFLNEYRGDKHDGIPTEWGIWCASELGWGGGRIRDTFAQFSDHWAAQPGQRGVKLDWFATWRNWSRRNASDSRGVGGQRQPYLTAGERKAQGAVADAAIFAAVAADRDRARKRNG